jgi:hypothetical protein
MSNDKDKKKSTSPLMSTMLNNASVAIDLATDIIETALANTTKATTAAAETTGEVVGSAFESVSDVSAAGLEAVLAAGGAVVDGAGEILGSIGDL